MAEENDKQPAPTQAAEERQPSESGSKAGGKRAKEAATKPRKSGGGRLLAGLALLISLAAAAGVGYLGWRFQSISATQADFATSSALNQRARELSAQVSTVQGRLDNLAQSQSASTQRVARLQAAMASRQDTDKALQAQIKRLSSLAETSRTDWLRGEAAYLATLADFRVRFQGDVDTALAALKAADGLLARLGGQSVSSRQAIAKAINSLLAVKMPDVASIATKLDALGGRVTTLPLASERIRNQGAPSKAENGGGSSPENRWLRAWDQFKKSFGELVIVHHKRAAMPLVAPEQRYFLYQNIALRLEAARLALLEKNQTLYVQSLNRAGEWLKRYFDLKDPRVKSALEQLTQLKNENLTPKLPELGKILEPVTSASGQVKKDDEAAKTSDEAKK